MPWSGQPGNGSCPIDPGFPDLGCQVPVGEGDQEVTSAWVRAPDGGLGSGQLSGEGKGGTLESKTEGGWGQGAVPATKDGAPHRELGSQEQVSKAYFAVRTSCNPQGLV